MTTSASALPDRGPQARPHSTRRKFLTFTVMAFGMFMALIDIQIVAASLNDVQAGLSAGPDEVSWVQTAYLIAELIMIPFSAFLAQALSTRWLFCASAALFTLFSVGCGMAWNIESMIVLRALQGFTGGAMVPTVFAVGFVLFEGKQRALVPAILGMTAVLAPTLGPTVGGLVTYYLDWRWIFFINVLPGLLICIGAALLIDVDRPEPSLLRRIDWLHFTAMALALGCFEYVLEEGPRKDWFGDTGIVIAAWVALVSFGLFIERSLYSSNPVVSLRPFRDRTFAIACLLNLVIGFGLYSSTYLVPVFLGRVRGFDSLEIGTTVFVVGIGQLVSTIVAARASEKVDLRLILSVGFLGLALSLWLTSRITSNWGFDELLVPQVARGLFLMLCIVPSVNMALGSFQGAQLRQASGLFNLMRNLGGAIGIATVNTWLQDDARAQVLHLSESLGNKAVTAQEVMGQLASKIGAQVTDSSQALLMAQGLFGRLVGREALTLAFGDVFRLMAMMFVVALLLVPLCRGPASSTARAGDAA
ncbi:MULTISPECIES: DHA2 family efflux MFS transporter permease subunit [Pseudomonas]|uniref:DHA2 family efflux MFS transporter permease subunit n=1 Tax=Pseudomonas sessilinigenes TaxID=658629 RepID=A0ABX8MP50_9PSED|nr:MULTISPECIES: DHA2 family efflux MFS transporter permease subunit [Pseudomonas]AZC21975.1 Inner-membrane proton/drug antiporter (MSF type) of tripartite multidrug efflux system [Pseudomonas sessilinigenes]QIH05595.1 DHA2 family efflux MFS transporter permease subunit [Pseudomonas sp. BIOMIG1BAC]QXH41075.1 DHA2 family efflux MFS transporter permease subunit [Pseudomonas sessilinigenes]